MADIAASVLARLKNKAAESGRSYQLCLQLFCQEEFLRRLEKSKYAENLVLKGGLFIYSVTDFDSRVTVDIPCENTFRSFLSTLVGSNNIFTYSQFIEKLKVNGN